MRQAAAADTYALRGDHGSETYEPTYVFIYHWLELRFYLIVDLLFMVFGIFLYLIPLVE